jgi:hypothetical protein
MTARERKELWRLRGKRDANTIWPSERNRPAILERWRREELPKEAPAAGSLIPGGEAPSAPLVDQAARILELEAALSSLLDLPPHLWPALFPCGLRLNRSESCPACRLLSVAERVLRGEEERAP